MSIGSIPCAWMASICSFFSLMARSPPWMAGWSVFTLPSSISGNLVTSETPVTGMLFFSRRVAVPPVERITIPSSDNPFANSTKPVLSETLTSALFTLLIQSTPRSSFATGCSIPSLQGKGMPREYSLSGYNGFRFYGRRLTGEVRLDCQGPSNLDISFRTRSLISEKGISP
jgi:hypothetical protein